MSLSWLPAAIALQSGLPSVSICNYLLFLCPLVAQQRRYDETLALLREAAAEAVRKHLAAQHWTETALIFDGHDYGPTPAPLIPGLLVAPLSVAASKPALTDSSVFRLILNSIFNLVVFFITLWIAYLSIYSVAYVVKLVISLISWVISPVFWITCSSVTWIVSAVVKIIVAAGSNVWFYLDQAKELGKGWCKRVDLVKLTSIAVSFFRRFASPVYLPDSAQCELHKSCKDFIAQQESASARAVGNAEFKLYSSQQQLGDVGRELRALKAKHNFEVGTLLVETTALADINDDLQEELAASQEECASAQEQLTSTQLSLGALSQARIDSDEQLEEAQHRIATLEGENTGVHATLASTLERATSLEESNTFLRGSVVKHKTGGFFMTFLANIRGHKIARLERTLEERSAQHAESMRTVIATIYGFLSVLQSGAASHNSLAASFASIAASLQSLSAHGESISASVQNLEEATDSTAFATQETLYAAASVFAETTAEVKTAVQLGTDSTREHVERSVTAAFAAHAARQDAQSSLIHALQGEVATLQASKAKLTQDNADLFEDNKNLHKIATRAHKNDTESRAEVTSLRIALDAEQQTKASLLARIRELELIVENAAASPSTPPASISHSDSTASFMALALSPSDDLLDVQLPESTSFASVDGFEPMSPIEESDPFDDDPFDSDPILAIPIIRLTRSAPSSPQHKFATTKHINWSLLHPSWSDPTDLSSYLTPTPTLANTRHDSPFVSSSTSTSTITFDPPSTSPLVRLPTSPTLSSRSPLDRRNTPPHALTHRDRRHSRG